MNFRPSMDWSQGGLIIERDKIATWSDGYDGWYAIHQGSRIGWYRDGVIDANHGYEGATALEAAMRCKVASVYGDEVPEDAR